jgi:polyhydroxyalkanoate synthesis regulator phasin
MQADLRQGAVQALHDLDARRTQIVTSLEEQATRLLGGVLASLHVGERSELAELSERLTALERRVEALARANAEQPPRAAVGS